LQDVGLGYITLGQQSTTLSGGEAQRIKLATELSKRQTGNTLYILDEPTTGLHFEDVKVLMEAINKLVDLGNSFIIIEHNLDVIKLADHIIDIGPEGGKHGGKIIAEGTPEEIAKNKKSLTAKFLKRELE
jgi:Excinuclease ATPase subunit